MKPTHSDSSSRQKAVWGNKRTLLAFLITLACLAPTMAAAKTQQTRGYTGAGIGIAALDSGVTSWHDDLTNTTATLVPHGNQRVATFVDFVTSQALASARRSEESHSEQRIGEPACSRKERNCW